MEYDIQSSGVPISRWRDVADRPCQSHAGPDRDLVDGDIALASRTQALTAISWMAI